MIAYLYLALALFAGLAKGFIGKKTSGDMESFRDCTFINLLRMLFCALVGFIFVIADGAFSALALTPESFGIYTLSAVSVSAFCVCWMYAYKADAYVFLNIFTMLGSIITSLLGFFIYSEPITLGKWIGMGLLVVAVSIMSKYNKDIKGKISLKGIIILVVGCLGCSIGDFSQKVYMKTSGESSAVFNFYTYIIAFVLLLILYAALAMRKKTPKLTLAVASKRNVLLYFLMSACLFLNAFFKTLAAGTLSSAEIYPVLQGANLILSGVMAQLFFGEKMNRKSLAGILTALAAVIIMSVL
ncbi:MAG: EamA family transporter [Clostridia bacterium]|nr:EamA family transporter [Clostridia bacterium]